MDAPRRGVKYTVYMSQTNMIALVGHLFPATNHTRISFMISLEVNLRLCEHECYTTPTGWTVYSTPGWCCHRWKELEWVQEWNMVPFVQSFHCGPLLPADMKVVQMICIKMDETKLVTKLAPAKLESWPYRTNALVYCSVIITWLKYLYLLFLIHLASKLWEKRRVKLDHLSEHPVIKILTVICSLAVFTADA